MISAFVWMNVILVADSIGFFHRYSNTVVRLPGRDYFTNAHYFKPDMYKSLLGASLLIQITHYKIPRYIKFVDSFPMTVSGKVSNICTEVLMQDNKKIVNSLFATWDHYHC